MFFVFISGDSALFGLGVVPMERKVRNVAVGHVALLDSPTH